ncbi:MAG: hypothetical protein P4L33_16475 [Capsulimonadaceae bacterium]|nr:hypothetical protein [Capsulimonadaceae bacterium]
MNTQTGATIARHFRNIMLAVAAGSLLGLSGSVRADLKVVEQLTLPSREGGTTQTITAYFHGDNLRLENDKGAVTLIDPAAGKIYNLDSANKVYNERRLPPKRAAASADASASDLKFAAASDAITVAGASATKYSVSGTTTIAAPPGRGGQGASAGPDGQDAGGPAGNQQNGQQGGPPQGGPPQGGPDSAGGPPQGGPDGQSQSRGTQSVTVSGEYWLSADLGKALTSTSTLRPYLDVIAGPIGRTGADALLAQLTTGNLFPVAANLTATGSTPDGQARTMKFAVQVQSVSTDALDASLFALPSDYTKVRTRIKGVDGRPERTERPAAPPTQGQD